MRPHGTPARIVVLLAAVGLSAVFLTVIPGHGWFDVRIYWEAVRLWQHGGRIYDYQRTGTNYGFTYPPFAAVCMAPLAVLGWPAAVVLNLALSLLAGAALLHWLVVPVLRRRGWSGWYGVGLAGCLFAVLNPVRDTFSLGQVNLLLLALVFADLRSLRRGSRFAGVGIGLATAVKLTPGLFVGYLLLTGRRREALTAAGTALGATLVGFLAMPGQSRYFWTAALWDTGRIGSVPYVSNQSLLGLSARLVPEGAARPLWLLLVLPVLALWARRARRAADGGDERGGFALTGLTCCLVSPITWVHHLVWMLPALLVLVDAGWSAADPVRRRRLLWAAAGICVLLTSGLVWLWRFGAHGVGGLLGANAYVLATLALLPGLPLCGVTEGQTRSDQELLTA
ncbi:glycosyltransferase 87 family protein [Kitasatospora viridis]|uniref:Alpha-1,2-mannosyltransferase n=1 Tax=Kitasatospora viridis TaxID=281105 RepID=A0A561UQ38_9ACTN|nr:glycosyltransferase 87 family protein [Kitasatospora viridis]TWG01476.1 alpha-1,2-mannosyltransferase [Kitasatospora viridis]